MKTLLIFLSSLIVFSIIYNMTVKHPQKEDFHYRDKILVTKGFYKGTKGEIIEACDCDRYKVDLETKIVYFYKEDMIKIK